MDPESPRTNLRARRPLPRAIPLAAAAVALGAGGLWLLLSREPVPGPAPAVTSAPAPPLDAAPAPAQPAPADGAPLDAESARAALEAASPDALFRSWLARGDLVRRWLTVTANLAEGESPRATLTFLAPKGRFTTVARGDQLAIAPEAYARYDAFADAVGSIDVAALASVYRRLRPVLDRAWGELGLSTRPLDASTARALRRIAGAPVVDGDVHVRPGDGGYAFVDPKLEALGAVEKHLLRMGPRNERILQAKARAILEALQLPVVATQRP